MTDGNDKARAVVWLGSAPLIKRGCETKPKSNPAFRLRGSVWQFHCATAKPNKGNRCLGVRR